MLHILKMFWFVIRELAFDSKEEYDFKSSKFNSRKVTLAVMLLLSLFLNIWTLVRFYDVSTSYIEVKKTHTEDTEKLSKSDKELTAAKLKIEELRNDKKELEELYRRSRLRASPHVS